jgi:hypothetical protein
MQGLCQPSLVINEAAFMFQLGIDTIRERATNGPTYMKGRNYYRDGHLLNLSFDQERGVIQSQVSGTRTYQVRIVLNQSGELHDATCTCSAFSAYWGLCKHIVAVLLYCVDRYGKEKTHITPAVQPIDPSPTMRNGEAASELLSPSVQNMRRGRLKTRDFLMRMQRMASLAQDSGKQSVRLRLVLFCSTTSVALPFISFGIGTDQIFPVTNVEQFAEAISRDRTLELDQRFTFDPLKHVFQPADQPLIQMLQEAYESDYKAVFGTSHSSSHDRFLTLNATRFARFLEIAPLLSDCSWRSLREELMLPVHVKSDPLPIFLRIEQDHAMESGQASEERFRLSLVPAQPLIQLTASRNVYLCGDTFYLPPRETIRLIDPILSVFGTNDTLSLALNKDELLLLMSEIRPVMAGICPVVLDPLLAGRLVIEPLRATVAMDWLDDAIRVDLSFAYGNETVNPLTAVSACTIADEHLVVRDQQRESVILNRLAKLGFVRHGASYRMADPDHCFNFIANSSEALNGIANITMSPTMKNLRVIAPPNIHFQVNLHPERQTLSVLADYDGLSHADIPAYIRSLREKRPYLRLSGGSFQIIDGTTRDFVLSLMDALTLFGADPFASQIELPQYRALAMAGILSANPDRMTADESFHLMVNRISAIGSLKTRVPAPLGQIMRSYQKTGFQWLVTLEHFGLGGILADDMGLGKTLQTLAYVLHTYRTRKLPTLIVAPTSLVYNWLSEAEKFVPGLPVLVIDGHKAVRNELWSSARNKALVITSYSLLRRDIDLISQQSFASCFIDEAQNIKNPDTLNARSVKQVRAGRYFALTGTPIENSLTELWSLFDFILPGYLFSRSRFQSLYEWPIQRENNHEAIMALHKQIAPFILRRMKSDVLQELPDKIETRTICNMTDEQREVYQRFLSQAKKDFETEVTDHGLVRSQIFILTLLTRLRQICCHPVLCLPDYKGSSGKMLLLEELLEDSFSSGHRVLVFSAFTSMLELIRNNQRALGREPFYIDGQVPSEERLSQVNRFNLGEGELFLISLRSGGTGLNLTGADTVIHYDPWWNPAVEEQATDRAYRIGQENVVQVFKLVTRQSIEEKIYQMQQQKKELMDTVITAGQNFLTQMSIEEIRSLFEI